MPSHPPTDSTQASSLRFAEAARAFGTAARREGLRIPSFRSPPRVEGCDRTMRRRGDGGATISIRLRGRPWAAVLADMVDGVVATNQLAGAAAADARASLWAAAEQAGLVPIEPPRPVPVRPVPLRAVGGASDVAA